MFAQKKYIYNIFYADVKRFEIFLYQLKYGYL